MKTILVAFNAKYVHTCLALYSLRAYAGPHHDISIKEFSINMDLGDCLKEIVLLRPNFVMISTYIWNIQRSLAFAREIKKIVSDVEIYCGGPEATSQADEILRQYPFINGIFMGEGEVAFRGFLEARKKGNDAKFIEGLLLRNEPYQSAQCVDMDELLLPYRKDDWPLLSHKLIYYESMRGCSFACSYCLSSLDRRTRFKSLDLVFNDIDIMAQHKVKTVKFVDRTFNINKERAMKILEYIFSMEHCKTCFHFEIRADLLDGLILALLASMPDNRIQLEIGLQSINQETLTLCNRHTDVEMIASVVHVLSPVQNMHIHLDLIVGLPHEGFESCLAGIEYCLRMQPHMLQIGFLKLLRGSALWQEQMQYGIVAQDDPPYEVLLTNALTFLELQKIKVIERKVDTFYNSNRYRHFFSGLCMLDDMRIVDLVIQLEELEARQEKRLHQGFVQQFWLLNQLLNIFPWSEKSSNQQELLKALLLLDFLNVGYQKEIPDFLDSSQIRLCLPALSKSELLTPILSLYLTREQQKKAYKQVRLLFVSSSVKRYIRSLPRRFWHDHACPEKKLKALWILAGVPQGFDLMFINYAQLVGIFNQPQYIFLEGDVFDKL